MVRRAELNCACAINKNVDGNIGCIPMLSANEQRCKQRLNTARWAGTFGAIIF